MQRNKYLSIIICCLTAMFITSCLGNDDEKKQITPAEAKTCMQIMRGVYTGKLYYLHTNDTNQVTATDSLNAGWIVNDSLLIINNYPIKALAENVKDPNIKAALLNAAPQPLICEVGFTNTSPIEFLVNPRPMKFKLNYNDEDHEMVVAYYVNSIKSFGIYNKEKDILEIMVCIGGIYIDENLVYNLSSGVNNLFSSSSHTK